MFRKAPKSIWPTAPEDGRLGWFEGLREDRLCGWTYLPSDPHRALEVTLSAPSGAASTIRADHYRADLKALGLAECCHGFSLPLGALPGAELCVDCAWTDLGFALPGSPWSMPRTKPKRMRRGSLRLTIDAPPPGDARLSGYIYDSRTPLRRVAIGARWDERGSSMTIATLHRTPEWGDADDGFHGFILPLPAPLRMLARGVALFDVDRCQILSRLEPRGL